MSTDYPDNCLRGIPKKEWHFGKKVKWIAFIPPDSPGRNAEWYESSINWEIDGGAITELQNRVKDNGEKHFLGGVARLPRSEIDRIIDDFEIETILGYEKHPIEGNPYHGNLLFHATFIEANGPVKADRAQIFASLARAVIEVVPLEEE